MKDTMIQINNLRSEIDKIDNNLLNLLNKRMKIVKKIGKLKQYSNIKFYDQKRKKDVILSMKSKAKALGLSIHLIDKIYKVIHEYSIKLQKTI